MKAMIVVHAAPRRLVACAQLALPLVAPGPGCQAASDPGAGRVGHWPHLELPRAFDAALERVLAAHAAGE